MQERTREDILQELMAGKEEMQSGIKQIVGLLGLLGLDVHIAPDAKSFVVISSVENKNIRDALMGPDMSNAFCFRLEFDLMAEARNVPESDIASGIFMKNILAALLMTGQAALVARLQHKEGASGSTVA